MAVSKGNYGIEPLFVKVLWTNNKTWLVQKRWSNREAMMLLGTWLILIAINILTNNHDTLTSSVCSKFPGGMASMITAKWVHWESMVSNKLVTWANGTKNLKTGNPVRSAVESEAAQKSRALHKSLPISILSSRLFRLLKQSITSLWFNLNISLKLV